MNTIIDMPDRWEYFIDSTYYRIYDHFKFHYVMWWNNGRWSRSQKTLEELKKAADVGEAEEGGKESEDGIVMKTIMERGPLLKKEIMKITGIVSTTCMAQLKWLIKRKRLKKSLDGEYYIPNKCQRDLFEVRL